MPDSEMVDIKSIFLFMKEIPKPVNMLGRAGIDFDRISKVNTL